MAIRFTFNDFKFECDTAADLRDAMRVLKDELKSKKSHGSARIADSDAISKSNANRAEPIAEPIRHLMLALREASGGINADSLATKVGTKVKGIGGLMGVLRRRLEERGLEIESVVIRSVSAHGTVYKQGHEFKAALLSLGIA